MIFVRYTWDHIKIDDHVNMLSERALLMPVFLRCMGNWIEGPKYYTKRENSYNYYLLFTIEGKGIVHHRNKEIILNPGQVCLIDSKEMHDYGTYDCDKWHSIWFHIYGPGMKCYFDILNPGNTFEPVTLTDTETGINNYNRLIPHLNSHSLSDELAIVTIITEMMHNIIEDKNKNIDIQDEYIPYWMTDIDQYIDNRIDTSISVVEMAKFFDVPLQQLETSFMYYKKKSAGEYIRERKDIFASRENNGIQIKHPKWVLDAVSYIEDNFSSKIFIQDIIDASYVSKPLFIKQFIQYTCMHPQDYLASVRLKRSLNMLQNTNKTITEIALNCGFPSASIFSKRFKEWSGQLPSEYRSRQNHTHYKIN